jgi:phosphoribosylformimino-5-aminoimidazole carboxamide ribonucleotide (ProFAR) isomerase
MSGIVPEAANQSLITAINESAKQFITTDGGIANAIQIQQLNDLQVQGVIMITLLIIIIIELYQINRNRRKQ